MTVQEYMCHEIEKYCTEYVIPWNMSKLRPLVNKLPNYKFIYYSYHI